MSLQICYLGRQLTPPSTSNTYHALFLRASCYCRSAKVSVFKPNALFRATQLVIEVFFKVISVSQQFLLCKSAFCGIPNQYLVLHLLVHQQVIVLWTMQFWRTLEFHRRDEEGRGVSHFPISQRVTLKRCLSEGIGLLV